MTPKYWWIASAALFGVLTVEFPAAAQGFLVAPAGVFYRGPNGNNVFLPRTSYFGGPATFRPLSPRAVTWYSVGDGYWAAPQTGVPWRDDVGPGAAWRVANPAAPREFFAPSGFPQREIRRHSPRAYHVRNHLRNDRYVPPGQEEPETLPASQQSRTRRRGPDPSEPQRYRGSDPAVLGTQRAGTERVSQTRPIVREPVRRDPPNRLPAQP